MTGPFTLLAPSNDALNMNPTLLKSLFNPKNMEALRETLLYHILPGFYKSDSFQAGPVETLLGANVIVSLHPLKFNQATATETDLLACNGAINVVDDLLIPPGKSARMNSDSGFWNLESIVDVNSNNIFIDLQVARCFRRFAKFSISEQKIRRQP